MTDSFEGFVRNRTKALLAQGRLSLCITLRQVRSVEIVRMVAACGYDSLYVDLEHGNVPPEAAVQICTTALDVGVTALARLPGHDPNLAAQILDGGAMGLIFPHVNTAQEARAVVAACKYPPLGYRSVSGSIPQMGFRQWPGVDTGAILNEQMLIIVQVETGQAVENVDAIAAVEGVDILLIGTNDLCADLGIHGQLDSPQVDHAYRATIAACNKHGKVCGVGGLASSEMLIRKYVDLGGRFISAGTEQDFLLAGARQRAAFVKTLGA